MSQNYASPMLPPQAAALSETVPQRLDYASAGGAGLPRGLVALCVISIVVGVVGGGGGGWLLLKLKSAPIWKTAPAWGDIGAADPFLGYFLAVAAGTLVVDIVASAALLLCAVSALRLGPWGRLGLMGWSMVRLVSFALDVGIVLIAVLVAKAPYVNIAGLALVAVAVRLVMAFHFIATILYLRSASVRQVFEAAGGDVLD